MEALERRDTHTQVTQSLGAWGERGKMERKRDERVKEAIIESVPETDPNGSRKENGEEAEVRNRLVWGRGKLYLN